MSTAATAATAPRSLPPSSITRTAPPPPPILPPVPHPGRRSAIRDVGKALGLTEDVTAALADTVWGSWGKGLDEMQVRQAGLDPKNSMVERAVELATELIEFPRNLSQHVGGYGLPQDRLAHPVPRGERGRD